MENDVTRARRWSPCGELHISAKKVAATEVASSRAKNRLAAIVGRPLSYDRVDFSCGSILKLCVPLYK